MQRNPIHGEDFRLQRESKSAPLDQQAGSLPAELQGPPNHLLRKFLARVKHRP